MERRVLIIGGQFSGNFAARDLRKHFWVTVVDCKEYFEYTPGILRAYVKPSHFDALTFTLQPVLETSIGVKFIWGEVKQLDGEKKTATIKTMFNAKGNTETIDWDYCMICSGCNFNPLQPMGESLWFPTVHEEGRKVSEWGHIDERFIEGRRRHILEEYEAIKKLAEDKASILVVGAGFIGVEWVTELQYYFPDLALRIIDFLPNCLGPLPKSAADYCDRYMNKKKIERNYDTKYNPKQEGWYESIGYAKGAKPGKEYCCLGVKASNYFVPPDYLSEKGPGGGKWIHMNEFLQVITKPEAAKPNALWGDGSVFAVGDCNYGCVPNSVANYPNPASKQWFCPPIPKISYPGEEQAMHAISNINIIDQQRYGGSKEELYPTWWPWGAGMFATSLGPHDACFVVSANENKGSGWMVNKWIFAAWQKEIIEWSKIQECRNRIIGILIWHFVHHTPINLWGRGPLMPRW